METDEAMTVRLIVDAIMPMLEGQPVEVGTVAAIEIMAIVLSNLQPQLRRNASSRMAKLALGLASQIEEEEAAGVRH